MAATPFLASARTPAGLTDEEARLLPYLDSQLANRHAQHLMSKRYYDGIQPVLNLGISTPPELVNLRAILGWCQSGVDGVAERLAVQGFRLPNSDVVDDELWGIWQANDLQAASGHVHLDALIYGTAYAVVGAGKDGPVITTESPLEMFAIWDRRTREVRAAFQSYADIDPTSPTFTRRLACLYTRTATVHLYGTENGWEMDESAGGRDDHNFGIVPVVPFVNRTREGTTEITDAWRNTTDSACRTTVAMEISREFYAFPHYYGTGLRESAFQDAQGNPKTAMRAAMSAFNAFEADEHGNLPTIGALPTGDPSTFTKVLDQNVRTMAGLTGLPPHYLGIFSDGNPASADAIRMSDFRLKSKADKKAVDFGDAWERVMRVALRLRDGDLDPAMSRMETDWAPTGIPTPAADTDAVGKQIAAGMIPPDSDVALAKVGYSAVERMRIANERKRSQGQQTARDLIAAVSRTTRAQVDGDPAAG